MTRHQRPLRPEAERKTKSQNSRLSMETPGETHAGNNTTHLHVGHVHTHVSAHTSEKIHALLTSASTSVTGVKSLLTRTCRVFIY